MQEEIKYEYFHKEKVQSAATFKLELFLPFFFVVRIINWSWIANGNFFLVSIAITVRANFCFSAKPMLIVAELWSITMDLSLTDACWILVLQFVLFDFPIDVGFDQWWVKAACLDHLCCLREVCIKGTLQSHSLVCHVQKCIYFILNIFLI